MSRRVEHGGGLEGGRRKVARPVSTQEPMYVLLRSTKAKGRYDMRIKECAAYVRTIVARQAETCNITVIQFANAGDSLHFLIKVPSRAAYLRFIRSVSGLVSRCVTGSQRGRATNASGRKGIKSKTKFWDVLPYSRICTDCATIKQAQGQIDRERKEDLGLLRAKSG
jgi:REP element-mobilizing transposase RayT